MFVFRSNSLQDTHRLGSSLGKLVQGPICIAIDGDLGAGKTTFVQGIAVGLGIAQTPVSPTFSLMIEYDAPIPLLHVDLYRVEERDLLHLGLEEQLEFWNGVSVVEWASRFPEQLPLSRVEINIQLELNIRNFTVRSTDPKLHSILEEWSRLC